jgi:predicted Zn-dependent protease
MPQRMTWQTVNRQNRNRPERPFLRPAAIALVLLCGYDGSAQAVCSGEAEKSRDNAIKIEQEWPLRPVQDIATRYLQSLGESLLPPDDATDRTHRYDWPADRWRFSMVRDLSANAFSIGDGRIYLTDGSIDFVASEAELAAILAHEIAHQLAGHFCAGSQNVPSGARQIGSLMQSMDIAKEMQADTIALDILRNAGFPASAMLEVVKRLPLSENTRQQNQRIEALLQNLQATDTAATFPNSNEFNAIKGGLR